jgi:hypothetical protein
VASRLTAERNADGRIEVFVRAGDGQLWSRHQETPGGDMGRVEPRRAGFTSDPIVVSNDDRRLEVFARGAAGDLVHVWQTAINSAWSAGWTSRGGNLALRK